MITVRESMTSKGSVTFLLIIFAVVLSSSCGPANNVKSSENKRGILEAENYQLKTTIEGLRKQVADLSAQNANLGAQYTNISQQFNAYKDECEAGSRELENMYATAKEFRRNTEKIEDKIAIALTEFESHGLDIYSGDKMIYVDMQNNLLFKSGSAVLSESGRKALGSLALVLNEVPKLKVTVVGNPDIIYLNGARDNWTLSTERATEIVRLLQREHRMDPARLTAAGRGKFRPIYYNDNVGGSIKNNRTEIVLTPDWDKSPGNENRK